jgi:glycerol-3-phosphate acyltransferase PlsY
MTSPNKAALPADPIRDPQWLTEAQRKAIHLLFILLPLELLHGWLPWPHTVRAWRLVLLLGVVIAVVIDVVRIHQRQVGHWFKQFLGELIRDHEQFNLLGSTYLVLAALLAIEIFPRPIAAAALGFTVLGDAVAALAGRAYGRTRIFGKSLEGSAAGLAACLAWAAYVAAVGALPWPVLVVGAILASLVELLPIPLDDNLAVTLAAGYAMKLLAGPA